MRGVADTRVLVLGQTGIDKKTVVDKVIDLARAEFAAVSGPQPELMRFEVEDKIKEIGEQQTLKPFLDQTEQRRRLERWSHAMEAILRVANTEANKPKDRPAHQFLLLHGYFYRRKQFFSCIDWDLLVEFQPTVIVTLIDDCFDIVARVKHKEEKELQTKSYINFQEALTWRSVETQLGDVLARNLYINSDRVPADVQVPDHLKQYFNKPITHFVVAAKHPVPMLYRLLFRRDTLRIYASFPISSTRRDKAAIKDINGFRNGLHKTYTVFDPVTIDEYRAPEKDLVGRWPTELADSLVPEGQDNAPPFKQSIIELREEIKQQVTERDLRLVEQSNCVTAYRPHFGQRDRPAGGVAEEIKHAQRTERYVAVYHPKGDNPKDGIRDGPLNFLSDELFFDSQDRLKDHLQRLQKIHADDHKRRNRPLTWER